jgi:hypothetical protein
MIVKIFARVAAVVGAAAITLATMLALVKGTILAVAIGDLRWRVVAACADIVLGTILLVACIYLATHLTVRILGVGNAEFPPLPDQPLPANSPKRGGAVSD